MENSPQESLQKNMHQKNDCKNKNGISEIGKVPVLNEAMVKRVRILISDKAKIPFQRLWPLYVALYVDRMPTRLV